MTPNQKAFLDLISVSEGTYGRGNNGYNCLVGGGFFNDYSDHPRQKIYIASIHNFSTAAGRYQLLARYFDYYKRLLGLPDFSSASQDDIALQQIKECGALADVEAQNMEFAVAKCSRIWASFPGNNYGQHQNTIQKLQIAYNNLINQTPDTETV